MIFLNVFIFLIKAIDAAEVFKLPAEGGLCWVCACEWRRTGTLSHWFQRALQIDLFSYDDQQDEKAARPEVPLETTTTTPSCPPPNHSTLPYRCHSSTAHKGYSCRIIHVHIAFCFNRTSLAVSGIVMEWWSRLPVFPWDSLAWFIIIIKHLTVQNNVCSLYGCVFYKWMSVEGVSCFFLMECII